MLIDDYVARFDEEPGYLDFAGVGPIGDTVRQEMEALASLLAGARVRLARRDLRAGRAGARRRRRAHRLPCRPGGVPAEHQPGPHARDVRHHRRSRAVARRVPDAHLRGRARRRGARRRCRRSGSRPTTGASRPGNLRDQLDVDVVAVAVSLVDFRTGYLVDLEGIRQVIGDRLLIVDAIQGFGVVDAPYELADVVVAGGQKWARAGWGTGFLALSATGRSSTSPRCGRASPGPTPTGSPSTRCRRPRTGARALRSVATPTRSRRPGSRPRSRRSPRSGVGAINARIAERVSDVIDLADEFAIPVVSPRAESERAGIVVLEPEADQLTVLVAALHNHGVSATIARGHGAAERRTSRPTTRPSRCCAPASRCRSSTAVGTLTEFIGL